MATELKPQFSRNWTAPVLMLIPALALLVWAGRSPQHIAPWGFTETGWIIPVPSLVSLWIAAAVLFGLLSRIAYLLFHPVEHAAQKNAGGWVRRWAGRLKPWFTVLFILILALTPRVAIYFFWPAPLLPWFLIFSDIVILAIILLLALPRPRRSFWWATLYVLHPLPLIAAPTAPLWLFYALAPFIFVVAISQRFPRRLNYNIAIVFFIASVLTIVGLLQRPAFNSLSAEILELLNAPRALLLILVIVFQATILQLARRRGWPLGKTLAHLMLAFLICSPIVPAWAVLPLLALAPIAWTRAGWVLSLTILAALAAAITPKFPTWLLMLEWMPVIVLEVQELFAKNARLSARG